MVDAANPLLAEQMAEVQRVLAEIGADGVPQVLVYNKYDKLETTQQPRSVVDVLELEGGARVPRVFVSALTGQGLDELRRVIAEAVAGNLTQRASDDESQDAAAGGPDAETDAPPRSTGQQHFHS